MSQKRSIFTPSKLKTINREIAIVSFYFDFFTTELFSNPILPIPMRIDKLTNSEPTYFIIPDSRKLIEVFNRLGLFINFETFYLSGLKNFIDFAKEKFKSITSRSLSNEVILKWYQNSALAKVESPSLVTDFTFLLTEFLKTYSQIMNESLNPTDDQYLGELIKYCDTIIEYFRDKLEINNIEIRVDSEIQSVQIYKEKKQKFYPQPIYIDVKSIKEVKPKKKVLIPYLIYDDIIDVFSYNKKLLTEKSQIPLDLLVYERNEMILKESNIEFYEHDSIEKVYKFNYTDLMKIL